MRLAPLVVPVDLGSRPEVVEAVDLVHKPEAPRWAGSVAKPVVSAPKQAASARKVVRVPRPGSAPNQDSDNRPEGSKARAVRVAVDPRVMPPRNRLSAAVSLVSLYFMTANTDSALLT